MIEKIEFVQSISTVNQTLTIPMVVLGTNSRYFIRGIDGLGPTKAQIDTSQYATVPGSRIHSARSESRNLVFRIGYNPSYSDGESVSQLRGELYRHLPFGGALTVYFYTDDLEKVSVEGWIESIEPNIFSKDPEIVVSVMCASPYFSGSSRSNVIKTKGRLDFEYVGTAPTGIELNTGPSTRFGPGGFELQKKVGNATVDRIKWNKTLNQGDETSLYVCTIPGQRKVTRRVNGQEVSGIYNFSSGWLMLYPGMNGFNLLGDLIGTPLEIFIINHTPLYVGL